MTNDRLTKIEDSYDNGYGLRDWESRELIEAVKDLKTKYDRLFDETRNVKLKQMKNEIEAAKNRELQLCELVELAYIEGRDDADGDGGPLEWEGSASEARLSKITKV